MARISNKQVYKIVEPTSSDYLIGTDAEDLNRTKTFTIQGIADFVSKNVTVGVGSLNGLVGAVTLSAGVGLVLTENGNDLTLSLQTPDFVESVNGLDGVLNVQGSTNIGVTDNGTDTITLTALNVAKTNETNTFKNDQTLNKSLSVAGGVFDVDFDTQRVGVNNPTPLYPLDIVGDTSITGTTGNTLTLKSPSEVGQNYLLFTNSLDANKGWVGYKGASDILQIENLIDDIEISSLTGSVKLLLGPSVKLETIATGVEVNGEVIADSHVTSGGTSNDFVKGDGSLDSTDYQGQIDAEEAARIAADNTLQGNIDAEATARANADSNLQNNIDAEESARIADDINLQSQVTTNASNISTNASNISANTSDIATNTSNISTNTSAISTNQSNITTNASNISTNASNIATNTSDISDNASDIITNANNISTNTSDIATNTSNISTNTSNIATNTSNIATNTSNIATNTSDIATNTSNIATNTSDIADLQNDKQDISEKNQANGYAPLDSGAKIPIANLPDSVIGQVEYQGTWNASTDTPTLPAASGVKGHYYVTSGGGTYEGIVYADGDWIISNGTSWEKVDNTDAVTSVFNRIGPVVANPNDYALYYPPITRTISAGTGLTGGGDLSANRTISHADTSSQSSVNNSGLTFIQDVTLDGFGHVTDLNSATVTLPTVSNSTITLSSGTGLSGGGDFTLNQGSAETITFNNTDRGSSQNIFKNVAVGGQSTIVADSNNDTLTFAGGTNVTITTNASTDTITINSTDQYNGTVTSVGISAGTDITVSGSPITTSGSITVNHADTSTLSGTYGSTANGTKIDQITVDARGHVTAITTGATGDIDGVTAGAGLSGGGTSGTVTLTNTDGGSSQNIFKNFAVSGQSTIVADSNNDTLTLAAGTNVSITTNASTDTVTINSTDQFTGTVTSVATGSGLTGGTITTSGTISHGNTSSQGSVDNSGGTVIQDVTLDGFGHVTGLASVNLDGRYVQSLTDTLDSVTDRGNTTTNSITVGGATINGNLDVTGTVTANSFSGNGSSLTSLNASNISSGTIADARLSSNVALKNAANTFTENQKINTSIPISMDSVGSGQFAIRGGTSIYPLSFALDDTAAHIYTTSASRSLILGTNETARLTITGAGAATFSGTLSATSFSGNGSSLTSLNASNISSGTLADARLSSNVALKNAANTFTQNQTISTSGGESLVIKDNNGTGDSASGWISFKDSVNARIGYIGMASSSNDDLFINADIGDVVLRTNTNGVGLRLSSTLLELDRDTQINGGLTVDTDTLFVDAANNRVGIGTSSPSAPLDVRGDNGIGVRFIETTTGNSNRVQIGTGSGFGYIDATAGIGSTALSFQVASTERMRIDSSGNVWGRKNLSLNSTVAPKSTWADGGVLELGRNGGAVFGGADGWSSANFLYISNNLYVNSIGEFVSSRTNPSAVLRLTNDEFVFETAATTTVNNALSFTERARITTTGLTLGAVNSILGFGSINTYIQGDATGGLYFGVDNSWNFRARPNASGGGMEVNGELKVSHPTNGAVSAQFQSGGAGGLIVLSNNSNYSISGGGWYGYMGISSPTTIRTFAPLDLSAGQDVDNLQMGTWHAMSWSGNTVRLGGLRSGQWSGVTIHANAATVATFTSGLLQVGGRILATNAFNNYTPDGLFSADALYSGIQTPNGAFRIRFGYLDQGGGQYWGRIGFLGTSNWSLGTATGGTSFSIGLGYNGNQLLITNTGTVQMSSLATGANRIVIANASGDLVHAVIGSGLAYDGTTLSVTGSGGSGFVTGSGSSGKLASWTGATSLGNGPDYSASVVGNYLVQRDGNGYIFTNWIHTSAGLYTSDGNYLYYFTDHNALGIGGWYVRGSGAAANNAAIGFQNSAGTTLGFVYGNSSSELGFVNTSGSWMLRVASDGGTYLSGSNPTLYGGANSAYLQANTSSTYGTWRVGGLRNAYTGFSFQVTGSNYPHIMYDDAGNGGLYNQVGIWGLYHNVGGSYITLYGSGQINGATVGVNGSLGVAGTATASNFIKGSDIRLKTDINSFDNGLDLLKKVNLVSYIKGGELEYGVIAQELRDIKGMSHMVYGDESREMLSVRYDDFHVINASAILKVNNKVETQEEKIKRLEDRVLELENQLNL